MSSEKSTDTAATLDARAIEGEPFGAITAELTDLGADETLLLVNSFEPRPLYSVLDDRGFTYDAEQVGDDEWHVRIRRAE